MPQTYANQLSVAILLIVSTQGSKMESTLDNTNISHFPAFPGDVEINPLLACTDFVYFPNLRKKNEKTMNWGTWISAVVEAEPFDLIEIKRCNGAYHHWVMYVGRGYVVHVTQVKDRTQGSLAEKRIDKLRTIAGKDSCRINNLGEEFGFGKRSQENILKDLSDVLLDGAIIVPYAILNMNCEHYVTKWRYGEAFSKQAEDALANNIPPEKLQASVELLLDLECEERKGILEGLGINFAFT